MPNKHFCQGPTCHEKPTTDRFLKSRGVIRGPRSKSMGVASFRLRQIFL
jgi:hypothetical protein